MIDPNYLSHEDDLPDLVKCIKIGREVFAQEKVNSDFHKKTLFRQSMHEALYILSVNHIDKFLIQITNIKIYSHAKFEKISALYDENI